MFDIIFENSVNTIGILLFFIVTFEVKDFIVDQLTSEYKVLEIMPNYHTSDINKKLKNLLIKGLFVCIAAAFVISFAMGRSSCDEVDYVTQTCITYGEESNYIPTFENRVGIFTSVFIYTYSIVILSTKEGKEKHTALLRKIKENSLNV